MALVLAVSSAQAATALAVDIDPGANCTSKADLNVSWSSAGLHDEFGVATDRIGNNIGTFGPSSSANNDYSGTYQIPITTQQPPNSLIGSYTWVGSNPPTPATAIEFFVLYNCSTRVVLLRCFGAFGACPRDAPAAIALLPRPAVPASSAEMLAAMMVLVMLIGGGMLHRRRRIGAR
ncbi:MAG TPA: hypothetical protein VFC24_08115 [Casimicrobiaceae bacterium]|nr:hypothetical protein [Casimicrobiaceae bacterium]